MSEHRPIEAPGDDRDFRLWAAFLHLSLLAGFPLPLIGSVIVPVIIYILKKDDHPGLSGHFNVVMNWILSAIVYGAAAIVLAIVTFGLGLPLMMLVFGAIALLSLIFAIVGAIKANDGELWVYPLSIPILR